MKHLGAFAALIIAFANQASASDLQVIKITATPNASIVLDGEVLHENHDKVKFVVEKGLEMASEEGPYILISGDDHALNASLPTTKGKGTYPPAFFHCFYNQAAEDSNVLIYNQIDAWRVVPDQYPGNVNTFIQLDKNNEAVVQIDHVDNYVLNVSTKQSRQFAFADDHQLEKIQAGEIPTAAVKFKKSTDAISSCSKPKISIRIQIK